jgi:hypothetical protein
MKLFLNIFVLLLLSVGSFVQADTASVSAAPRRMGDVIYDYHGNAVREGDRVRYRYNEAIGTVIRVEPRTNRLDVDWNIVGSGYGRLLPGDSIILDSGFDHEDPYGFVFDYDGNRVSTGDIVSYRYNEAVGTVVAVYPNSNRLDVDWNIVGSGYGRLLSANDVSLRSGDGNNQGVIFDAYGNRVSVGDVVSYRYNEAVGTVVGVYPSSNRVDVDWNIVGSGYGRQLPGEDVILR